MRQRTFFFFLVALCPALAGCTRSAGLFSEQNAHAHVSMLAGTIGSRPIGSEANARARAYVIDQLKLYGYDVRVQETDARRAELGRTAHVSNIIAALRGRRPEAIGLVSHYDSAPESPGAADDGLGVAVSLEAARVLAGRPDRQWTTLVLVTDGEESGLMGAAALVTDRDVTSTLQAYINVEAAGSGGTAVLFEAGPANAWVTRPWARSAPHPRGGSFGIEVYRRLPNDTDFTILARQGIPGLNFAAVDDGYSYHTARDVPERLGRDTLRKTGENVVAVAVALDRVDITQRGKWGATFFDIGGVTALSYSMIAGWLVAATSLLIGVLAWVKITSAALRIGGRLRWVFTAIWSAAGATVVVATMIGVTWALRAARQVYHPWYAHPNRMFLLLAAAGITAAWTVGRVGAWLPARVRGVRHPVVTWSLTLPIWLALAAGAIWLAPGAAYLWTLPLLLASGLLLVATSGEVIAIRLVSIVVLGAAGTLWLRNTVDLLRFATAVFGRLPIITPAYVYAAILTGAGVMIVPPFVAAITRVHPVARPSLITALCLLAVAVTAGSAALAPAYTFDQPLRRHIRALQEADGTTATWEIGSIEPGLDLTPGAPGGWSRQSAPAPASIPWGKLTYPFVFRASGAPLGPAPVEIAGFAVTPVQAGTELAVTVIPRRSGLAVSFVLPAGLTPARTSLPGAQRLGRWTAAFIAPPAEGIAWRARFAGADAARLRGVQVAVTDFGFPGGAGWQRLPAWLPQERAVWTGTTTWVVPAGQDRPLEPVPPLR
jgi:peptidase M28-like protein